MKRDHKQYKPQNFKIMDIKEIKKTVVSIIRENGFKKVSVNNWDENKKQYYLYDGTINFYFDNIFYSFGVDKLSGFSSHICTNKDDLSLCAIEALNILKLHITGQISANRILKLYFAE